ncbi:MAG: GGDEF domain-containing protein, partial [Motiliproteus sp.]
QGSYTVSINVGLETSGSAKEVLIEPGEGLWKNPFLQEITSYQRVEVIDSESQSFELTLIKSICWADIHVLWLIVVTLSGSVLAFYLAHCLTRYHSHRNKVRDENLLLYRRANFDQLTLLPNINLLIDRAEQAIFKAHRGNAQLGVCYLDIN